MDDPAMLTATQARAKIAAGTLSPEALMEACLDRIATRDPDIQAMAFLDKALAWQGAKHARPGALHGLPVGVKDVLDTADMPSQYNSPIWRDHQPRSDAAAVAWTKAAGGVILGKTVTTEFATPPSGADRQSAQRRAPRPAAPAAARPRGWRLATSRWRLARRPRAASSARRPIAASSATSRASARSAGSA